MDNQFSRNYKELIALAAGKKVHVKVDTIPHS